MPKGDTKPTTSDKLTSPLDATRRSGHSAACGSSGRQVGPYYRPPEGCPLQPVGSEFVYQMLQDIKDLYAGRLLWDGTLGGGGYLS
eukprot:8488530-Pyramimonas_sp.AAC.1